MDKGKKITSHWFLTAIDGTLLIFTSKINRKKNIAMIHEPEQGRSGVDVTAYLGAVRPLAD